MRNAIFVAAVLLFLPGWLLFAEAASLNENCVVSVLNRTVQVKSDGTWVLPNIPANFGPVRARATCVQEGKTLSGQSESFTVPANGSVDVPEIVLGPTTPIPNRLTLTAGTKTLTQPGQTLQLTVTGAYADGSSQNLSTAASGTQYLISNADLASISPDGLVTAKQSGTVLVQAINEGTQGLLQLSIVLSADSDGDGIPDDVEIREGLDPNNPADALDDPDRDGLTNKDELQRGTDLHNADSDGDGLSDGEEIELGTNPLLKDSDGDGVPDNIEVATGSDPNDPNSVNLAGALKQIKVTPAYFIITVNSIDPIAFQQLTVTGEFKLGGTINLTARSRGTDYATGNVNVCNFGAEDGRVYGGSKGSCIITVKNNGFTATASGSVQTFTPQALSYVSIPGFANNVEVSGNYAYVASGSTGLQVVDVSDKAKPKVVAALDTPGNGNDVAIVGTYAYLADDAFGLRIIDISNPLVPVLAGVYDTPGVAWDVTVRGGYAFVADGTGGLQILDVSNPAAPSPVGSLTLPGTAKGVDIDPERQLAVVAAGTNGLHVVNIRDVAAPVLLATAAGGDVRDVAIDGNTAFLADYARSFTPVDLSNPASPVIGASTPLSTGGRLQDIALAANFALGADVYFVNGVPLIDVSLPASPQPRAIINFSQYRDDNGTGIAADASYLYLTAARSISENGIIGDTRLYIGQYRALEDPGVAPTVSISTPHDGDTVIQGTQLAIAAQAFDDAAVAAVTFTVNGNDVFTDTTAPYETTYTVPDDVINLEISAEAVDLAGNQALSLPVNVAAIPDPLTTATGTVVDKNGTAIANAEVTCLGIKGLTDSLGLFSIPGLSTLKGNIACTAMYLGEGAVLKGFSQAISPVQGDETVIGEIYITPLSNYGRDFWVGCPATAISYYTSKNVCYMKLIILSETDASFTISATGYNYTGSVGPQNPVIVPLPTSLGTVGVQQIESKGIHITSDVDISVLLGFYSGGLEMALAIPTNALGGEYFAIGYPGYHAYPSLHIAATPSEFLIVGTENNSNVDFLTTCQSLNGTAAGTLIHIALNAGQTYQYQCLNAGDITGTKITSDKPIGVISGAMRTAVPANAPEYYSYFNLLFEMMFPVETLYGKDFYSAPFPDGIGWLFDRFRILAAEDGTMVTVDQGTVQNIYQLNAGEYKEISLGSGTHFASNLPISVTQYSSHMSSQMQLIPINHHKYAYRFHSGYSNSTDFFSAVIIAPNDAIPSIKLNGNTVSKDWGFTALPGDKFQYALVPFPFGQSVITAEQPIAVYVYTRGYYSITYPAGF